MNVGSIARRYAKALLSIGIEDGQFEQYGAELHRFAQLMHGTPLAAVLGNPTYAPSRRRAVLDELITRVGLSETVANTLRLLLDRGRAGLLPSIAREYQSMADAHAGRVRAAVTSARQLDAAELARLQRALEQQTGKQVIVSENTDEDLIAGLVTRMGSVVYDGSVRTRLAEMRQVLLTGGRHS